MIVAIPVASDRARMSGKRFAIQLMIAQGLLFATETAAIHQIGHAIPLMQLALLRAGAGVALAVILGRHMGFGLLWTRQLPLQLLRGGIGLGYLWVMVFSFSHLPFADATALSYTQAAYIAVFSVVILGEAVTRLRWLGAVVGIVGALLIAKPAFASWNFAYLVALFGTSLNGLGFVLNRYMQREDSELTTMFYTNLVPFIASLPGLAMGVPAANTLVWLPAIFLLGPLGMFAGIVAVKHANASMLGPYTLLRLVIGLVGAVAIFREFPDLWSAVGAGLILVGCLLSSRGAAMKSLQVADTSVSAAPP
jgi:drug/metabolite transporter (DMT)-like permease